MGRTRIIAGEIMDIFRAQEGRGFRFTVIQDTLKKRGFIAGAQVVVNNLKWLLERRAIVKIEDRYGIVKYRGDGTGYFVLSRYDGDRLDIIKEEDTEKTIDEESKDGEKLVKTKT